MNIIDLSRPISDQTPVYPGDPKVSIETASKIATEGYTDHLLHIGTHVGTHIDAPAHMISGGKTLDQFPPDRFIGRGRYIDATDGFTLSAVKQAGVDQGDIVLFHTGMAEQYGEDAYFEHYPSIPEEVAQYLVAQEVAIVGVDMCSPDHEPFAIHKLLLGGDVLIIENLTNLGRLANHEFGIMALPLPVALDGAPVRVLANIAS